MAQVKVNGAVADGQFLTADLAYFIVDDVSGAANISQYGYTAGVKNAGEKLVHMLETVGTLVILENVSANVAHIAIEAAPGIAAADIQTALRTDSDFSAATVAPGTFTVV